MMRRVFGTALAVLLTAAFSGTAFGQRETAQQYHDRAGKFYVEKHLPEAVAQIEERIELSDQERDAVARALHDHIYRVLGRRKDRDCFTPSEWREVVAEFDRAIASTLPTPKAEAIARWREDPAPEGNSLWFLFSSDFAVFERIVINRSPPNSLNCGLQRRGQRCGWEVDKCVFDAVKAGRAFRAMYEDRGIDSQVGRAIIGREDGSGLVLHWDSMGSKVTERPCVPSIGRDLHGREHIDCD